MEVRTVEVVRTSPVSAHSGEGWDAGLFLLANREQFHFAPHLLGPLAIAPEHSAERLGAKKPLIAFASSASLPLKTSCKTNLDCDPIRGNGRGTRHRVI